MKSIFTRESFIPKNAVEIKSADSSAVAYLARLGDIWQAKGFSGKRAKPDWHYSLKTEAQAREHIAQHAASVQHRESSRAASAAQYHARKCRTALDVWNKVRQAGENGGGISAAETAICLRAELARQFPGVKFSVTSENYSMGCAVRVHWTDGPSANAVDRVAKQYSFKGFDGMVDCGYYKDRWLARDGSMSLAHSPGHAGGGGSESIGDPHSADCVLVTGGAGYVTTAHHLSYQTKMELARKVCRYWDIHMPEHFANETELERWLNTTRGGGERGLGQGTGEYISTLVWRASSEPANA
jgi:hypothetical protein